LQVFSQFPKPPFTSPSFFDSHFPPFLIQLGLGFFFPCPPVSSVPSPAGYFFPGALPGLSFNRFFGLYSLFSLFHCTPGLPFFSFVFSGPFFFTWPIPWRSQTARSSYGYGLLALSPQLEHRGSLRFHHCSLSPDGGPESLSFLPQRGVPDLFLPLAISLVFGLLDWKFVFFFAGSSVSLPFLLPPPFRCPCCFDVYCPPVRIQQDFPPPILPP